MLILQKAAQRDVVAAFGHCSLSRLLSGQEGVGCSYFPPGRGGGTQGCGGCFCCQQGNLVTAEAGRRFSHSPIYKAMSNRVRAACAPAQIQKLHFSLMANSSGVVSLDLESSRSFLGRQSGEKWQLRENEVLWLKMPMVSTLLGKFQLSLLGGDLPVGSHQCHLSHGDIYQWNCRN